MVEPREHVCEESPLISAAGQGKLRLVRLLLEGGAQVNECNRQGETALLAACRAMRGEQAGSARLKVVHYLLQHGARPDAQDEAGRTGLMYACMERAGPEVASALVTSGANPTTADHSGASALVYAINAQHQKTLQVLLDACQAKGSDVIIITTDLSAEGSAVTRPYLNVPPSPNTSPVACMSPSDIELKTCSPHLGADRGSVFNFRNLIPRKGLQESETDSPNHTMRQCDNKTHSLPFKPWLAIQNLAPARHAYDAGLCQPTLQREEEEENAARKPKLARSLSASLQQMSLSASSSHVNLRHVRTSQVKADTCETARGAGTDSLAAIAGMQVRRGRRNTLASLTPSAHLTELPQLTLNSNADTVHLHPPSGLQCPGSRPHSDSVASSTSSSWHTHGAILHSSQAVVNRRHQARAGVLLPPLLTSHSTARSAEDKCPLSAKTRSPRRHSVQLDIFSQGLNTSEYVRP